MGSFVSGVVSLSDALSRAPADVDVRTCDVAAPISLADLQPFVRASRQPFPQPIVEFLSTESQSCVFDFLAKGRCLLTEHEAHLWPTDEPIPDSYFQGGGSLCNLADTHHWMDAYQFVPEGSRKDWYDTFIFMAFTPFDFVGLDLSCGRDELPVVMLSHEDFSKSRIAPNFQAFLSRWEQVRYLNPSFFFEFGFLDMESGELIPEPDALSRLLTAFPVIDLVTK